MSLRSVTVIADNRQTTRATRVLGLFLVAWGAGFAGIPLFVVATASRVQGNPPAISVFIVLGLAAFFGGLFLLLRRRQVRFEPERRLLEDTRSFLGRETTERTALAAFDRVALDAQRGEKGSVTYSLTLRGPKEKALSLGDNFGQHGDAVQAGLRAAAVTGLPLDDCDVDGHAVRLRADQLAGLAAAARAQEAADAAQPWWRRPSALALVAANLVPLFGVLYWDWQILPLMLLFWLENLIVGFYTVARMALAQADKYAKFVLIPFFLVHYGMFCMGHGLFVFALFGPRTARGFGPEALPAMAFDALWSHGLFLAAIALVISHGVSFVTNYLRPKAYEVSEARTLMFAPYKRIVVLHVVILLGGFFAQSMGNFIVPLVLLVGLKIAIDLGAHLAEHRAPILREYKALAETAGIAVVRNKPPSEVVTVKDINDRPLAHYLGGWRLAPGESAPPGWFAAIEFRGSGGKLGVHLTSQPGGEKWTLESASVRGDASRVEWIEVRLRAAGPHHNLARILRFTAPGAGGERLDLNEVQQPEGNPRAMQAKSFALVRAGISHPVGVN